MIYRAHYSKWSSKDGCANFRLINIILGTITLLASRGPRWKIPRTRRNFVKTIIKL